MNGGREWQRKLWIIAALAFLGGFAWLVLRPHEPVFEGQPLSVVLHQAAARGVMVGSSYSAGEPSEVQMARLRAERALRALGTNALPILVKWAGARMSIFRRLVGAVATAPASRLDFLHLQPQEDKPAIAAWGMRFFGSEARPAVPALTRLLSDRDPRVKAAAEVCLAGIGPAAAEAVPALVRLLRDPKVGATFHGGVVSLAARALGEIGPAAGAAVSALEQVTNDATLAPWHEAAAVALIKISQGSFQAFFERLKDTSDPSKWDRAADEVGRLGTEADPAIPLLLAGLAHTNDTIRSAAIRTVAQLHRQPGLCLGPLVSTLNSTNARVRMSALDALGKFGPAAKPVAPDIARFLSDPSSASRVVATNVLRLVEPDAPALKGKRP